MSAATPSSVSSAAISAFHDCFERYQDCLAYRSCQTSSSIHEDIENYVLDFELSGRRAVGADSELLQLFRLMFVEQRSAEHCGRVLNLNTFALASAKRRLEAMVGETLIRRGLFPLNNYFQRSSAKTSETLASLELLAA